VVKSGINKRFGPLFQHLAKYSLRGLVYSENKQEGQSSAVLSEVETCLEEVVSAKVDIFFLEGIGVAFATMSTPKDRAMPFVIIIIIIIIT